MTQYLLLIHGNATSAAQPEEWEAFFSAARASGLFQGGSALGARETLGDPSAMPTDQLVGFMQFKTDDRAKLLELLEQHPVLKHGGSAELCEMPKT